MRRHPPKPRILRALAAAWVATLCLAGCETTVPEGTRYVDYQAPPRDLVRTVPRAVTQTVYVDRRTGRLSAAERRRIDTLIADFGGDRPGSIHATIRAGGHPLVLRQLATVIVADGVEPQKIKFVPLVGRGRTQVTLALERAVAVLPDCPGWIDHVAAPVDNRTEPNFGCSNVSNFAAMVTDPQELRTAQASPYHDGEYGAVAVKAYRADKVKELPKSGRFNVITGTSGGGQ